MQAQEMYLFAKHVSAAVLLQFVVRRVLVHFSARFYAVRRVYFDQTK